MGDCLFIASDATKNFFSPLGSGKWRLHFLSEVDLARHGVSKALSGLVEQLVAFGFERAGATAALQRVGGDLNAAIDVLSAGL